MTKQAKQAAAQAAKTAAQAKPAETQGAGAGKNDQADVALYGSDKQPSNIEIGGKEVQLGTVVAAAHQNSGLTVADWNALGAEQREAAIAEQIATMRAVADFEKQEAGAIQGAENSGPRGTIGASTPGEPNVLMDAIGQSPMPGGVMAADTPVIGPNDIGPDSFVTAIEGKDVAGVIETREDNPAPGVQMGGQGLDLPEGDLLPYVAQWDIKAGGKRYGPGDDVAMLPDDATRFLASGALKKAPSLADFCAELVKG